jgi:hypothetical protein
MYEEFNEIVKGYIPAAQRQFLAQAHVEAAIAGLARREHLRGQCVSCCFSRAPKNIMEIAIVRDRLPTDVRRCIYGHRYNRECPNWRQLEVPEEVAMEVAA